VRAFAATSTGAAEGADSAVVEITPEDAFAPSPPTEMRAVASETAVEISWNPSPEADLAGYVVYRRAGAGEWARLTTELLATPTFSDRSVVRGQQYEYAVSAADTRGNESARSAAIQVSVP
jgi:fibronectin type 3 domain-containing protein